MLEYFFEAPFTLVPLDNCLRLDVGRAGGHVSFLPETPRCEPEETEAIEDLGSWRALLKHGELLVQGDILDDQVRSRAKDVGEECTKHVPMMTLG